MTKISWELPIKTVSEANCSEHWTKKSRRHRQQQHFVRLSYLSHVKEISLPCHVTMTRLATRMLDKEDNLPMSMKWIKDELAECIIQPKEQVYKDKKGKMRVLKGRCDDDPRIIWHYAQEKNPICSVRIEIDY